MTRKSLSATVLRGGTSRGVFLRAADLPVDRAARDDIFTQLLGSPDPAQVDGLGGGLSSNSKVMVVEPAAEPDLDLRYEFAQIGVGNHRVTYDGNCGNLSSAVAAYALAEGMCAVQEPVTRLRMLNINTGEVVTADVPCADGQPVESFRSAHLTGTDPEHEVVVGFAAPEILTSRVTLEIAGRRAVVTAVGGANPALIVGADGWIDEDRLPAELNQDEHLLEAVQLLRAEMVRRLPQLAAQPDQPFERAHALPRVSFLRRESPQAVATRTVSMGRFHHAIPVTVATAVASVLATEAGLAVTSDEPLTITITHPKGHLRPQVMRDSENVLRVGIRRSVRTVMKGLAYYADQSQGEDESVTS